MNKVLLITGMLLLACLPAGAQCFATSGNPVGGTANLGIMDLHTFRVSAFYRYFYTDQYFSGGSHYSGDKAVLRHATYNYTGFLMGYGLMEWLTAEAEAGYYFNKTQAYYIEDAVLTGQGLSNLVISLKPRLFFHPDERFEISTAIGANIPFSRIPQMVSGVVLPIDIQPSTGSYGIVFQAHAIKENSFRGIRYFFISRIEKYFENRQDFLAGNHYSHSIFFSKHYVFEGLPLKDWTFILQLRNQVRQRNTRADQQIEASGNCLFFLTPQVNLSIGDRWNISALYDIPLYQYFNGIQIGNQHSFALSLIRDFNFNRTDYEFE